MSTRTRLAAIVLAVALCTTAGCATTPEQTTPSTPSEGAATTKQDIESAIGDMVSANSRVEASPAQDGLTTGWSVEIDRATTEPLSAEELQTILEAVWTNAASRPAFVRITLLTDGGSRVVDLTDAATELGVEFVMMREVYVFQVDTIEGLLGSWGAS